MSHEMMEHDNAAYFKNPAWHGLGNVVEDAMSINDALHLAELNWEIYKRSVWAEGIQSDDYKAVIRDDIQEIIGIVSPSYKIVQNHEVFALANNFGSNVKVESAGSIQNGRKVYLLLQGDSFDAGHNDEVQKYMALFWGHDGSLSLSAVPTSIRVVCKNTLDMVIGQAGNNKIVIKHAGDIQEKLQGAREAIKRFNEVGTFFEQTVQSLARSTPSVKDISMFFTQVYQQLNNTKLVTQPTNEKEEKENLKAVTTIAQWVENMERESTDFGINFWVAANAVTNHIQHRVGTRGRKKTPASSAYSNLIGQNSTDSVKVVRTALSMV